MKENTKQESSVEELTHQEIILALCRYAGGEAKCQRAGFLGNQDVWDDPARFDIKLDKHWYCFGRTDLFRLVLQPLHKITKAHAVELIRIVLDEDYPFILEGEINIGVDGGFKKTVIWVRGPLETLRVAIDFVQAHRNGAVDIIVPRQEYAKTPTYNAFIWQYLTLKGYAVPLFFGVGHPANGKNAIELGLAVYATE